MHDSLRRMDEWIDLLFVVLVVSVVGVVAMVPRLDRDLWDPIATLSVSTCVHGAAGCAPPAAIDP